MTYTEIQGDLFQHLYHEPSNGKLRYTQMGVPVYCHCIANDGRWGAGIAPVFIDKVFHNRNDVLARLDQHKWDGKGWCAMTSSVLDNAQAIFEANLITKRSTSGKPSYVTITESLKDLRAQMEKYYLMHQKGTIIRMPKIGCGLDGLDWDVVSTIIKGVFVDTDVNIQVYYL